MGGGYAVCLAENSLSRPYSVHDEAREFQTGRQRAIGQTCLHKYDVFPEIRLGTRYAVEQQQLLLRALRTALATEIFYLDHLFHTAYYTTPLEKCKTFLPPFVKFA